MKSHLLFYYAHLVKNKLEPFSLTVFIKLGYEKEVILQFFRPYSYNVQST